MEATIPTPPQVDKMVTSLRKDDKVTSRKDGGICPEVGLVKS